jgi:Carbohydrate-binding family 9
MPLIQTPRLILVAHLLFLCFPEPNAGAQERAAFPPIDIAKIRKIQATQISEPIKIDGKLDEPSWAKANRSESFVDLITGSPTHLKTHVSVLWDQTHLYLGYQIEEPNLAAKFKKEDDPIYQDNDVEFFIAGRDGYYEFEINAHGTIYDGLFVWQSAYETSGLAKWPQFDRTKPNVQSQAFNGVGYTKHPRGLRWAFLDWDFSSIQSAVHLDGTLNDPSDTDQGWSVEVAIPWKELAMLDLSKPRDLPPKVGDVWRIDFSRFNQTKDPANPKDSGGWALSPHGVWDSHIPEVFPYVTFAGPGH